MGHQVLRIRREQLDAILAETRKRYPATVARYVAAELPDRTAAMTTRDLERWAREQVRRAERHGVVVEWDLCRLARLELLCGPAFDETCRWARDLLARTDLGATERVDQLEAYYANHLADR